jgi:DNA-binding PadR family transcriptional regulator
MSGEDKKRIFELKQQVQILSKERKRGSKGFVSAAVYDSVILFIGQPQQKNQAKFEDIKKFLNLNISLMTSEKTSNLSDRTIYNILQSLMCNGFIENLQKYKGLYGLTNSGRARFEILRSLHTCRKLADLNRLSNDVAFLFTWQRENPKNIAYVDVFMRIKDPEEAAALVSLRKSYNKRDDDFAKEIGRIVRASLKLASELPRRTDLGELLKNPVLLEAASKLFGNDE